MMGPKQEAQAALFYEFSLEDHVPQDHLLRSIDRFVDLSSIRAHLAAFCSHTRRRFVGSSFPSHLHSLVATMCQKPSLIKAP